MELYVFFLAGFRKIFYDDQIHLFKLWGKKLYINIIGLHYNILLVD
jgi:hypothetical protein